MTFFTTEHTPERLALGDAAVNEALRLRPDLPEAHLALAAHLYYCYRDFERARVQIAIAGQTLSNNSDLLELTALIDRVQGQWKKSIESLERAATLDPRNPELLGNLAETYSFLRRFQDALRILDRVIELRKPEEGEFLATRAWWAFNENADVDAARAASEALPSSIKDDPDVISQRVYFAWCARDYAAAEEILRKDRNEELSFFGALVPRQIWTLLLEFIRGNHPTMEEFGAAREQLYRKVLADPSSPFLMMALALADVALGRNEEGIQEGRRAMEMRPISEDAWEGPEIAKDMAGIYACVNQLEAAFAELNVLVKMPSNQVNYGDLKTCPEWDPLRKDPRFDKLLAELAPKN